MIEEQNTIINHRGGVCSSINHFLHDETPSWRHALQNYFQVYKNFFSFYYPRLPIVFISSPFLTFIISKTIWNDHLSITKQFSSLQNHHPVDQHSPHSISQPWKPATPDIILQMFWPPHPSHNEFSMTAPLPLLLKLDLHRKFQIIFWNYSAIAMLKK